jgi:hypothetical protein
VNTFYAVRPDHGILELFNPFLPNEWRFLKNLKNCSLMACLQPGIQPSGCEKTKLI